MRWFDIKKIKKKIGVKQGCNMRRFLFLTVTDWAMRGQLVVVRIVLDGDSHLN